MSDEKDIERRKGYSELAETLNLHTALIQHELEQHTELIEIQIDEHELAVHERLRRFFSRALGAFAVLGVTSTIGLLGFGILLRQIQHQRYDVQYQICTQQNERHDKTIAKLIELTPPTKEAQTRTKGTILLIDALQPYVSDCAKQARTRVEGNT